MLGSNLNLDACSLFAVVEQRDNHAACSTHDSTTAKYGGEGTLDSVDSSLPFQVPDCCLCIASYSAAVCTIRSHAHFTAERKFHQSIQPALAYEDPSWLESSAKLRMAVRQWQTAFSNCGRIDLLPDNF